MASLNTNRKVAPSDTAPSDHSQPATIPKTGTSKPNKCKRSQEVLSEGSGVNNSKCPRARNEVEVDLISTTNGEHMNSASSLLLDVTFDASKKNYSNIGFASIFNELPIRDLNGAMLCDSKMKRWRLGKLIGKGGFGEIFLASDNISTPVTSLTAKYVAKFEAHSSGSLFTEMHCLINGAKYFKHSSISDSLIGSGAFPHMFGHGTHQFMNTLYRFIIIQRYHYSLASLIKYKQLTKEDILVMAMNMIDALEKIHCTGYCHNDLKAENIMIMKHKCPMKPVINPESKSQASESSSVRRSARIRDLSARRMIVESSQQQPIPHGVSAQNNAEPMVLRKESLLLIDLGLATRFQDHGVHRPYIKNRGRCHAGTVHFCSRDAHTGVFWRRSDLECLGYNLLYWSEGYLPWSAAAAKCQYQRVQYSKELFMVNVRHMIKQIYGRKVPSYLGEFLHLVGQLDFREKPDYERYRDIFKSEYRKLGYDCDNMQLNSSKIQQRSPRIIFNLNPMKRDILILRNSVLHNLVSLKPVLKKILLMDPCQIVNDRVAEDFESDAITRLRAKTPRPYDGKPNYAILKIQQRLRSQDNLMNNDGDNAERSQDIKIANDRAAKQPDAACFSSKSRNTLHYDGIPTYAILEVLQRFQLKNKPMNIADDSEGEDKENDGPKKNDGSPQRAHNNDDREGYDQSVKGMVSKSSRK